jgi:hypothetical protein
MKAIIVYKRDNPSNYGSRIVSEEILQREIRKLKETNHEIICVLHVSFALQVRQLELVNVCGES